MENPDAASLCVRVCVSSRRESGSKRRHAAAVAAMRIFEGNTTTTEQHTYTPDVPGARATERERRDEFPHGVNRGCCWHRRCCVYRSVPARARESDDVIVLFSSLFFALALCGRYSGARCEKLEERRKGAAMTHFSNTTSTHTHTPALASFIISIGDSSGTSPCVLSYPLLTEGKKVNKRAPLPLTRAV